MAKWTIENLSHSFQKSWILLILKPSYLAIPAWFFITNSTTVLQRDTAVYIQYPGFLGMVAGSFPLNASRKRQSRLAAPQCRTMAAWSLREVKAPNSHSQTGVKNFPGHVRAVHHHRFLDCQSCITTSSARRGIILWRQAELNGGKAILTTMMTS